MTPSSNNHSDEPMTLLATVDSPAQADAMRMELEMNGIRVEVQGQIAANMLPIVGGAFGGIPIRVPASELQRARQALANRSRARERGMYECPQCGSDSVTHTNNARQQMPLLMLCVFVPFLWPVFFFLLYVRFVGRNRMEFYCRRCKHEWVEMREKKATRQFWR